MSEIFDAKNWIKVNGEKFNGEYADIKKIDPTLDTQKIRAIGNAIADIKLKEVSSRKLDEKEAMKLLST